MKSVKSHLTRVPVLFMILALLLAAGCDDKPKDTAAQAKKSPLIGIFLYNEDVYITSVATAFAEALSGKAEVELYSALNDQPTQNEQIDAMLSRSPDVLVVNLVEAQAG